MELDRFKIKVLDDYNFSLYETRAKRPVRGEAQEGTTEAHIGYYGNLGSALKSMAQQVFKTLDDKCVAEDLFRALTALESSLNDRYGNIKPSNFKKGEEL